MSHIGEVESDLPSFSVCDSAGSAHGNDAHALLSHYGCQLVNPQCVAVCCSVLQCDAA